MNALRIEGYLRSACSVLNFDIGELWTVRENPGQAPTLSFIQLYTSPTYEDFHKLLIRPKKVADGLDEERHKFSPVIVRGVCEGGQIVWANTKWSKLGVLGHNDLPLNTAVGMPICSVGMDLCVLVLFAVDSVQMTTNAVEFLSCIARAASERGKVFLPSSIGGMVTCARTDHLVGIWDMYELLSTYMDDVDFRLLPIEKLQDFCAYQEYVSLMEIFGDFCESRDGKRSIDHIICINRFI